MSISGSGSKVSTYRGMLSKADFVSKLAIACKEARETHYSLRLFAETNVVSEQKLNPLIDEANQLVAILTTIIKNTRASS